MIWFQRRFLDTDGAAVPEFEAWCRRERPIVFALRCDVGRARAVAHEVTVAIGEPLRAINHRGTYPWTRYVLLLEVERDEVKDVVLVRATDCAMRRGHQAPRELGAI